MANRSRWRVRPLWGKAGLPGTAVTSLLWTAIYSSLKMERVFRCMMGGPGEALSAKGFQHAFCQSDSGEELNYWLVLVL